MTTSMRYRQARGPGANGPEQGPAPDGMDPQSIYGNAFVQEALARDGALGVFDGATRGGGGAVPFRSEMEALFGQDFSDVSAFLDPTAAGALGANAVTDGRSVVFGGTPDRRTVAHELAHVVQHRNAGSPAPDGTVDQGGAAEGEAERAATDVLAGRPTSVEGGPDAGLHRDPGHAVTPPVTPVRGAPCAEINGTGNSVVVNCGPSQAPTPTPTVTPPPRQPVRPRVPGPTPTPPAPAPAPARTEESPACVEGEQPVVGPPPPGAVLVRDPAFRSRVEAAIRAALPAPRPDGWRVWRDHPADPARLADAVVRATDGATFGAVGTASAEVDTGLFDDLLDATWTASTRLAVDGPATTHAVMPTAEEQVHTERTDSAEGSRTDLSATVNGQGSVQSSGSAEATVPVRGVPIRANVAEQEGANGGVQLGGASVGSADQGRVQVDTATRAQLSSTRDASWPVSVDITFEVDGDVFSAGSVHAGVVNGTAPGNPTTCGPQPSLPTDRPPVPDPAPAPSAGPRPAT